MTIARMTHCDGPPPGPLRVVGSADAWDAPEFVERESVVGGWPDAIAVPEP
jgi:hypothetical protein